MRIALARFDATVGDVPGNARRMIDRAVELASAGAQCIAFPELALCGYPPRDLLQREGFLGAGFGTATPREALDSHRVFAAAVRSQSSGRAEPLD